MRRLLVTGGAGALARHLATAATAAGWDVRAPDRAVLDVTDPQAVDDLVASWRPVAVIHPAAIAGVDRCEREPDLAMAVNAGGTATIARACARHAVRLVTVSTDLVFGGGPTPRGDDGEPRGWRSDDTPAPVQVYGRSKLAGERRALAVHDDVVVARTSVVASPGGGGFVGAIAARALAGEPLRVVTDQVAAPTFAADLSPALLELVDARVTGVVHRAGEGHVSRHGLAVAVVEALGLDAPVEEQRTADLYPAIAPRPSWTVLDQAREREQGLVTLPHWRDALARHLGAVLGPGAHA